MIQRWLASVLLYCEEGFNRIKGFASIPDVIARIENVQEGNTALEYAA